MTTVAKCGSGDYAISYTTSNEKSAYDNGAKVFSQVEGKTNDSLYEDIDKAIKDVNSTTVLHFLSGFYSGDSHEGIIEYLDDENDKNAKVGISMEGKLNLLKSLIECAKRKDLTNCPEEVKNAIEGLTAYFEVYTNGELKDAKDFNRSTDNKVLSNALSGAMTGFGTAGALGFVGTLASSTAMGAKLGACGGPWGLLIGTAVGLVVGIVTGLCNKTTDDEIIDEQIKILYKYLKETEDKKTLNVNA